MLFNPWPEILLEARTARGLSQENSAARAGVALITWYRWEKGIVYPGYKSLDDLARGVDIDPAVLALRYAKALWRHYEAIQAGSPVTGSPAADGPPAGATPTVDRPLPAAGESQRLSKPTLIRGLSSEEGAVWVDFNEIVDLLWQQRPHGSEDEPRPRPTLWPRRRRGPVEP